MARDPIKFRCFQCQKLLGVSPTKAGATVACPKCGAALLVPDAPPEVDPAALPSLAAVLPADSPLSDDASASFPTLNFGDLRLTDPTPKTASRDSGPERVTPPLARDDDAPDAGVEFPVLEIDETSLRPDSPRRAKLTVDFHADRQTFAPGSRTTASDDAYFQPVTVEARPVFAPAAAPVPPAIPAVAPTAVAHDSRVFPAEVAPTAAATAVVPASLVDAPAVRAERPPAVHERLSARRRDDVLLPRTAVLLWSFFVIVALAFAFGEGALVRPFPLVRRALSATSESLGRPARATIK